MSLIVRLKDASDTKLTVDDDDYYYYYFKFKRLDVETLWLLTWLATRRLWLVDKSADSVRWNRASVDSRLTTALGVVITDQMTATNHVNSLPITILLAATVGVAHNVPRNISIIERHIHVYSRLQ